MSKHFRDLPLEERLGKAEEILFAIAKFDECPDALKTQAILSAEAVEEAKAVIRESEAIRERYRVKMKSLNNICNRKEC